jgi:carbon starvation protein
MLLIYAFFASILPVWLLLQPGLHQQLPALHRASRSAPGSAGLAAEIVGPAFGVERSADAAVSDPAPGPLPFLFFTIACEGGQWIP